jgi:four helix bundle protein
MPARARSTAATPAAPVVAEPTPAPASVPATETAQTVQLSGYRGLKVWQRAMDLAAAAYHVAAGMADRVLADDLWRTAMAIPANIAAGNSLYDRAEYVAHLSRAHGKVARLECLLYLADRLHALPGTDTAPLLASAGDIGRMLRALARALQPKAESDAVAETVN